MTESKKAGAALVVLSTVWLLPAVLLWYFGGWMCVAVFVAAQLAHMGFNMTLGDKIDE